MSWKIETDVSRFLHANQKLLLEKEAENNFLLQAVTKSVQSSLTENIGFSSDSQSIAFLYSGTVLLNSVGENNVRDLADFVVDHFGLEKSRSLIQKVFGPEHLVQSFSRSWLSLQKGVRVTKQFALVLHKLSSVLPVGKKPGQFRRAWLEELDVLAQWYKEFCEDTGVGNETDISEEKIVLQMINSKQLFVWGQPRAMAMAAATGSTPNGIRINCVYTPREKRGQGYAKSLVSSLCDLQLSQGKEFVVLFSDALKPQNAELYKSVGFEAIGDYLNYSFSI